MGDHNHSLPHRSSRFFFWNFLRFQHFVYIWRIRKGQFIVHCCLLIGAPGVWEGQPVAAAAGLQASADGRGIVQVQRKVYLDFPSQDETVHICWDDSFS